MPITTESYVRPFGSDAPWNIPVDGLELDEDSDLLASLLWNDTATDRDARNFNINNTEYTYAVYEVTDTTPYYRIETTTGWGNITGTEIPFDPFWQPAPGDDGQMIILDPATGREWDLFQVSFDGETITATNGNLVSGGGDSDSYFERELGFAPSRGVGIQYLAMLVRPEEVAAGVIEHALSMPIQNTSGAEYVSPGTKIEFPGERMDGIPEGTRFSLDVTYEEIDVHIAGLPDEVSDATRESLRIIMVAMKDYGWFITDTSGGTHIQLESTASANDDWAELGMVNYEVGGKMYPRDALDGLMSESRIVAYVPSDQYSDTGTEYDPQVDDPFTNIVVSEKTGEGSGDDTVAGGGDDTMEGGDGMDGTGLDDWLFEDDPGHDPLVDDSLAEEGGNEEAPADEGGGGRPSEETTQEEPVDEETGVREPPRQGNNVSKNPIATFFDELTRFLKSLFGGGRSSDGPVEQAVDDTGTGMTMQELGLPLIEIEDSPATGEAAGEEDDTLFPV